MRIKDIIDCGREVQIVLKATREEMTEGHWHWHDEVEIVRSGGVVALPEGTAEQTEGGAK